MDTYDEVELRVQDGTQALEQPAEDGTIVEQSLPPTDRGASAWLALLGAFLLEGLVWGTAFSYGIFQEHYNRLPLFQNSTSTTPLVGTIASGFMFLCSPLLLPLLRRFPNRRKQCIGVGGLFTCTALLAASFAENVAHLIATQGVLFAVGGSMVYYPTFLFIDEWFVRRKALAYGICWGASGLSGLVFPFIISWLLRSYDFRVALRVWALVDLLVVGIAFFLLKPRLPSAVNVRSYRPRLTFTLKPLFIAFCLANIIAGLGTYLPGLYLPSYARSVGLGEVVGTSSVSLLNIGTLFGSIGGGFLADRWSPKRVVIFSSVGALNNVALLWGFSAHSAVLLTFGLAHGLFTGCVTGSWPGIIRELIERDTTSTAEPTLIFALFVAGRGIGNVAAGPLSQSLLNIPSLTKMINFGYGSMYGSMILFSACTMAAGGFGALFDLMGIL